MPVRRVMRDAMLHYEVHVAMRRKATTEFHHAVSFMQFEQAMMMSVCVISYCVLMMHLSLQTQLIQPHN